MNPNTAPTIEDPQFVQQRRSMELRGLPLEHRPELESAIAFAGDIGWFI
jgi:hypothetical protein